MLRPEFLEVKRRWKILVTVAPIIFLFNRKIQIKFTLVELESPKNRSVLTDFQSLLIYSLHLY